MTIGCFFSFRTKKHLRRARTRASKNRRPRQLSLSGFPLWLGGELLSHVSPQYHRRGGA